MRAGVRPGLQILRVCLWWAGRFDSDTLPPSLYMGRRKRRKPKPFQAFKEVKRQARLRLGSPPPLQRHESHKRRPPKHKELNREQEAESFLACDGDY